MPAPITVRFAIGGQREVIQAFETVKTRAMRLNQDIANDNRKVLQIRVRDTKDALDKESRESERQQAKLARAKQTKLDKEWRDFERFAEKVRREDEKLAADAAKNAKKEADARLREADRQTKELAKEEAKRTRNAEREAKKRADEEKKRLHEVDREKKKQERAAARAAAEIASRRESMVGGAAGLAGRAGRSTWGTVTGVAGAVGATAGTYAVIQAVRENLELRNQAAQLVNATRAKGTGEATQSIPGLIGDAQGVASKYGFKATDVMEAMSRVSAQAGGAEGLMKFKQDLDETAKTALAYGVSMQDMGDVVAAALKAGITPGKEMNDLLQDMAAMGKDGAVEIKDLASELGRIAASGLSYGMKPGDMVRRQVGLAQIAVDATKTPEEARTAVKDLERDINTHAASFRRAGVQVYDKNNAVRDPALIIADIMDAAFTKGVDVRGRGHVKGNEALSAIFTGTSSGIIKRLIPEYNKGGKAGVEAKLAEAAGSKLAPGERDKGVQLMLSDPSTQWKIAMAKFEVEIAKLVPKFVELLPHVTKLTQSFAEMAVWAANNPWRAVFILLGANLAKEIAAAGIGAAVRSSLVAALDAMRPAAPIPAPGAAGAGAAGSQGMLAKVGAVAAAATVGYAVGEALAPLIYDPAAEKGAKDRRAVSSVYDSYQNQFRMIASGNDSVSPQEAANRAAKLRRLADFTRDEQNPSAIKQVATLGVANIVAETSKGGARPEDMVALAQKYEALAQSAEVANKGLEKLGETLQSSGLTNPGSPARNGTPTSHQPVGGGMGPGN